MSFPVRRREIDEYVLPFASQDDRSLGYLLASELIINFALMRNPSSLVSIDMKDNRSCAYYREEHWISTEASPSDML